jgi:hypothetical protein
MCGDGVRVRLACNCCWKDSAPGDRTIALKGTVSDAESLYTTLRYRLAGLTLDGAVEEITLELSGLTAVYARQEQLFGTTLRRRQQQRVSEAVKQLKQRYGATPLYRVVPIEPWSRIPERRWGCSDTSRG